MLSVITHNLPFFSKKEIWFYNGEPIEEGSYTVYCYASGPPLVFDTYLEEQSAHLDLRSDMYALFANMSKTYQYEVRKAEAAGFQVNINSKPTLPECEKFIHSFNAFAKLRKAPRARRKRILSLQRSGNLILTSIRNHHQELITHVYIHDSATALLLHSYHMTDCEGQTRGMANKYLHWQDMLFFKQRGFLVYDLGGINFTTFPGITRFKLGLGATPYTVQNYIHKASWVKPFYSLYRRFIAKI